MAAGWDGLLALQSDKVLRGASQSGGSAVLALDGSWRGEGGLSLVGGLSTLGPDTRRGRAEWTLGAGWGGPWGDDAAWRVGATRYDVLGAGVNRRPMYGEASASLGWQGRWQVLAALAPAYPGALPGGAAGRGQARSVEFTWHEPLARGWAVDAGLGRIDYRTLAFAAYAYGNLGLSWQHEHMQCVVSHSFNTGPAALATPRRVVLSLLWRL